jgi:hypothetical protein
MLKLPPDVPSLEMEIVLSQMEMPLSLKDESEMEAEEVSSLEMETVPLSTMLKLPPDVPSPEMEIVLPSEMEMLLSL